MRKKWKQPVVNVDFHVKTKLKNAGEHVDEGKIVELQHIRMAIAKTMVIKGDPKTERRIPSTISSF